MIMTIIIIIYHPSAFHLRSMAAAAADDDDAHQTPAGSCRLRVLASFFHPHIIIDVAYRQAAL